MANFVEINWQDYQGSMLPDALIEELGLDDDEARAIKIGQLLSEEGGASVIWVATDYRLPHVFVLTWTDQMGRKWGLLPESAFNGLSSVKTVAELEMMDVLVVCSTIEDLAKIRVLDKENANLIQPPK